VKPIYNRKHTGSRARGRKEETHRLKGEGRKEETHRLKGEGKKRGNTQARERGERKHIHWSASCTSK
jgi:hypothetical protein